MLSNYVAIPKYLRNWNMISTSSFGLLVYLRTCTCLCICILSTYPDIYQRMYLSIHLSMHILYVCMRVCMYVSFYHAHASMHGYTCLHIDSCANTSPIFYLHIHSAMHVMSCMVVFPMSFTVYIIISHGSLSLLVWWKCFRGVGVELVINGLVTDVPRPWDMGRVKLHPTLWNRWPAYLLTWGCVSIASIS